MFTNGSAGHPAAWHSVFCPRPTEMAALQATYEAVADPDSPRPGVVVLLSESGLGKTRLVQEFFRWLSTTKDGIGEAGYWPDVLAREGDNLRLEPDPADCNPSVPLPFLWWGLRLTDPGRRNGAVSLSVLASCGERFGAHLEPMLLASRKGERKRDVQALARELLRDLGAEVLASFVPGVGVLAALHSAAWKGIRVHEQADGDCLLTPGEADARNRRTLSDKYFALLHKLLDMPKVLRRPVPVVFVVDDAHWADQDAALLELVDRLLFAAKERHLAAPSSRHPLASRVEPELTD